MYIFYDFQYVSLKHSKINVRPTFALLPVVEHNAVKVPKTTQAQTQAGVVWSRWPTVVLNLLWHVVSCHLFVCIGYP